MNPDEIRAALQGGQIGVEQAERAMVEWLTANAGDDLSLLNVNEQARKFVQDSFPGPGQAPTIGDVPGIAPPTGPANKLLLPATEPGGEGPLDQTFTDPNVIPAPGTGDAFLAGLIADLGQEEGQRAFDLVQQNTQFGGQAGSQTQEEFNRTLALRGLELFGDPNHFFDDFGNPIGGSGGSGLPNFPGAGGGGDQGSGGSLGHDGGQADLNLLRRLAASAEIDAPDEILNTFGGGGSNVSDDPLQVSRTPEQILSQDRSGRNTLFQRFLAQNPDFASGNAITRRSLQTAGDPLSAQFSLQQLQNIGLTDDPGQGNFASFLQNNPGIQSREAFLGQIGGLGNVFGESNNPSLSDSSNETINFRRGLQQNILNQDATGGNIISSLVETGLNPFFRGRPQVLNRFFNQALGQNPGDSLFKIFLDSGIAGFGGQGGFG